MKIKYLILNIKYNSTRTSEILIGKWREIGIFKFKYFNVYNNCHFRQGKNCSNLHKNDPVVNALIFHTLLYNIKKYKQTRSVTIACAELGYYVGKISYQRSECFTEYWFHNTVEVCVEICRGMGKKVNRKNARRKRKQEKCIQRASKNYRKETKR